MGNSCSSSSAANAMGVQTSRVGGVAADMEETIACDLKDLETGKMKEVKLSDGRSCVMIKESDGHIRALSGKCTHYGAPLAKGSYANGKIRCPWHGACFNAATGDIEDFPGLDSLHVYDVAIGDKGEVKVRAPKGDKSIRRAKILFKQDNDNENTIIVIGGGAAGQECVETLRQDNRFTGRLILITKEADLPYDRPKLSKALSSTAEELRLRSPEFYRKGDIEVKTNSAVTNVDTKEQTVQLSNGENLKYDRLVVATGSSPRSLDVKGHDVGNVFVLRTPHDANKIATASKGKDAVVVGTSFIGMEVAAFLATTGKAASVTVIGHSDVPFKRSLGAEVGKLLQNMHEAKNVKFVMNADVEEFVADEGGNVSEIVLKGGDKIKADIAILGVGVKPNTDFLKETGVELTQQGHVRVNEQMEARGVKGVYAAGDIASFPLSSADEEVNIGHWQLSMAHGRCAALNAASSLSQGEKKVAFPLHTVPFFWTQQYGKSIRYAGYSAGYDDMVVDGSISDGEFAAYYCKGDKVVAVATLGKDPVAAQFANLVAEGKTLSKENALENWQKDL